MANVSNFVSCNKHRICIVIHTRIRNNIWSTILLKILHLVLQKVLEDILIPIDLLIYTQESRKNSSFLSGPTTKRKGGGVRAGSIRKKNFFEAVKKVPKKRMNTNVEGGVGGWLVGWLVVEQLRKEQIFAASLSLRNIIYSLSHLISPQKALSYFLPIRSAKICITLTVLWGGG